MYTRLSDSLAACHDKGITTFLVTNGTNPKVLADLDPLPTQLYVTVAAPTRQSTIPSVCPTPATSGGTSWRRWTSCPPWTPGA